MLSADKSPSDLEGIQERLKSRLNNGLVADIHATTYELRLGILQSKAERLGLPVPRKVMEFVAHRITSNVRELEGALNRVVAHAQLIGREISVETAQEVLHDLLRANDRRITIDDIQKQVAAHFNIRIADMSFREAGACRRPAATGGNVPGEAVDLALAAGDRSQVRRPRSYDGDARGAQG